MTNNNQSFFKRTPVRIGVVAVVVVLIVLSLTGKDEVAEVAVETTTSPRTVSLYSLSADNGTAVRTADGSAFIVRAQSGGRVDRVAKVGDTVAAGATVAQLENSAQRAAYIQAEGAYDAAVAGVAQGSLTVSGAENTLNATRNDTISKYATSYNTIAGLVVTVVDSFFSNPDSFLPGLKIFGAGNTAALNANRIELQTSLPKWQEDVAQMKANSDLKTALAGATATTDSVLDLVDGLLLALNAPGYANRYTDDEYRAYISQLTSARDSILGTKNILVSAGTNLVEAEEALERAKIVGSSSGNGQTLANAQVKQALGVLESARAALAKTIIKTPVAGTVTAVSISVGDIINVGNDVVFVASSDSTAGADALVTVPLTAVKFTPTKAYVFTVADGVLVAHEVVTGLVTSNSITISGAENLTEIVSDVRGLKAGDAVVTK